MKLTATLLLLLISVVLAQQDPNCMVPNPAGGCNVCAQFYYILNGKCTQVNANCLGYNSTNGKCTSCMPSYQLNSKG